MSTSTCCGGRKLGRCTLCIRLAALGAAGSLAAVAALVLAAAPGALVAAASAITLALSALLGAHLVAFLRRVVVVAEETPPAGPRLARSALLWAALGAFLGLVLGRLEPARAQEKKGGCDFVDDPRLLRRFCVGECGPLYERTPDDTFKEVKTGCHTFSTRKQNGDSAEDRCVCVVVKENKVLGCNVKNEAKKGEKFKLECEQTCPTLYRPTPDARRRWEPVEGKCVLIGEYTEHFNDTVKYSCVCVYEA